jgi:uncharacterized protein
VRGATVPPPDARLAAPDALRGFALLLIACVNAWLILGPAAPEPWAAPPAGHAGPMLHALRVLLVGKGVVLFAFLFGWGFAVLLERGMTARRYAGRMAALGLIGALHGTLVWPGDILLPYAVLGLALLAFRDVPVRLLVATALLALSVPVIAWSGLALTAALGGGAAQVERLLEPPAGHLAALGRHYTGMLAYGWTVLGAMLLGMAARRRRLFRRIPVDDGIWRRVWIALVAGLPLAGAYSFLAGPSVTAATLFAAALLALSAPPVAAVYAAAIVRLARGGRPRPPPVRALISAGRLPLTNYLGQTFVLVGLGMAGLRGAVGPAGAVGIGILLVAAQALASRAWLRRFSAGPVEAGWRWLGDGPHRASGERSEGSPRRDE